MVTLAEVGEVDAIISAEEIINSKLVQMNLQTAFYILKQHAFFSSVFPLVHANNLELAEIIREGFEQIPDEVLIELENNWIYKRNEYFVDRARKINFSSEESLWLKVKSKIKVGIIKALPPVEFVDAKGQVAGINIDILDLLEQRTGLEFEYQTYNSWFELYQGLLNNEVDMLGSITPTKERKNKLLFSKAYWDMPWVILHPHHLGSQSSLNNFYGKKLAIVKGYHLITKLREQHPGITLMMVDNINDGLTAVQKGLVDGFIETIASASELMKKESLMALMISVVDTVNIDMSHFAIQKELPQLRNILDKGLLSISDEEKQGIYEKWFNVNIQTGFDKNVVLRVSAQIGAIILVVIIFIVVWNRRLYVEIKRRKALEVQMKHMATHDELTGLANRVLLKDRINTAIHFHQRQKLKMAVLFLDLDGFKVVNDTYGHDVGDELLVQVSKRLENCVRESDTVVRFGGDEFVLLLTGIHSSSEASHVAEKVLSLLHKIFKLSKAEVKIGCSIGIAVFPDDGLTDVELLKSADTLMYQVKADGKNNYAFSQ